MSKNQHSEIKIAIIGAFASVIFTAIYDWVKDKPVLSTFKNICKWLWKNIFQFEIKVGKHIAYSENGTIESEKIYKNDGKDYLVYTIMKMEK